jgi:heme o synthase
MHDLAASPRLVARWPALRVVWAYFALTKPRVMELLLVTTAPVMILAARGIPNAWLIVGTLFGGFLSGGGAAAFNMYLDRDIDARMERTAHRPIVTGEVSPRGALVFSWVLAVGATVWFGLLVNWLTAALSAFAIFFYVVIYTVVLKRRTEQNIVWGGIAGCFPVLIGWAAVDDGLSWSAFVLFVLVFLWTPAHYWPLSVRYRDDYRAVDVPMLGATRSPRQVAARVLAYAVATVMCSLLLVPVARMGALYGAAAVLSGAWFVYEAVRLFLRARRDDPAELRPMRVFHSSVTYLTIVCVAVALDPLLR